MMDEIAEIQRRRYPRAVPLKKLAVAWQSGSRQGVSYLGSLALGGMFLLTRSPLPMRSAVKLLLELPFGEVRARGVVRRINPARGMGIEFISMGPEARARLIRALQPMLSAQAI
jgi:c-di-GMP-binding flagellar brake protein YcgR